MSHLHALIRLRRKHPLAFEYLTDCDYHLEDYARDRRIKRDSEEALHVHYLFNCAREDDVRRFFRLVEDFVNTYPSRPRERKKYGPY